MSELKNQVESLLFSSGKRLTVEELGRLCKEENLDAIKVALELLQKDLDDKQSSLMLVREGEGYKLTVREKYISVVKKVVTTPDLPKSITETLAVVAYKAPVLQSQVIKIRTNKAYRHLDEIEELGYITREKKGRSKLIKLTPKFFDYFDVPPEKLKEKFKNVAALEQAIEAKEKAIEQTREAIVAAAHDNKPRVEVVTDDLPKLDPSIEVLGAKVGELETYGEAPKPKKKHRHKKHKEEEAPKTQEEAAAALAAKILGEAGLAEEAPAEASVEEATEEEKAEMEEEGRITVEKIRKEAAETKPTKSKYTPEGLFSKGMPEEVKEKVEHRVAEITGAEKSHEEETGEESAEFGMPEMIPAPKPMTEEEETKAEEMEEVKSEEAEAELTPEEEEEVKEVEEETPAEEAAEEEEKAEEPAEKESVEEQEEAHEAPKTKAKKHKHH
jgi:segregation and condensation protein B